MDMLFKETHAAVKYHPDRAICLSGRFHSVHRANGKVSCFLAEQAPVVNQSLQFSFFSSQVRQEAPSRGMPKGHRWQASRSASEISSKGSSKLDWMHTIVICDFAAYSCLYSPIRYVVETYSDLHLIFHATLSK